MTEPLTISLVIPAYNEEAYIGACLDAVARNVQPHVLEVIVVDNNSTDRTAEVIAEYPGVVRVFESEKGITKARQCGFAHARGDILAFVDADTLPPEGWVDQIKKSFAEEPGLACLSGPYLYYDLSRFRRMVVSAWFVAAKPVYHLLGYLLLGGNFAIRRDVLEAMGGFDASIEFYGEDADIARRAKPFGRVLFDRHFVMPTSGRRLQHEGQVKTAAKYLLNFAAIAWRGRPVTQAYSDIR